MSWGNAVLFLSFGSSLILFVCFFVCDFFGSVCVRVSFRDGVNFVFGVMHGKAEMMFLQQHLGIETGGRSDRQTG